jgi:hypothetical protein
MTELGYPATGHDSATDEEDLKRLEAAMQAAPRGALTISGIAVALLLLGWFFVYLFIFLPRGAVG